MATIDLDIDSFRTNFDNYSSEDDYSDTLLNTQYEFGKCYIADNDCTLGETCREYALQLMLAHLLFIRDQTNSGNTARVITSATEGKVSVSLAEPPSPDNWYYWLNTSPYGTQIIAMLEAESAGGFYVGGMPERKGFRKIGGRF